MVHGNGERASTTSPWRDSSDTNERLDQWLRCPGVLPRSRRYAPRAMFSPRQSGSRGTETSSQRCADARHLGDGVLGVGHVLEDLDRRRHVELAVGERQVLGLHHAVLEVRRLALLPLGVERRVVEVDADDALVAEAPRPLLDEHALAAADVEDRLRARPATKSSSSVRSKPAIRRRTTGLFDPYLSYVLPVTVPSRSTVTDGCSKLQGLPFVGLLAAGSLGVGRGCAGGRRLLVGRARPARSATAGRRAAARSAARARRCAGPSSAGRTAGRR